MRSKVRFVTVVGLLLALLVSGVVYATTITVDGNPADWPGGAWLVTDPQESPPFLAGADLSDIYFTNDTTNLYWRFDTYANTEWGELEPLFICMDTDNNQGTGSSCACGGGGFISDYVLVIRSTGLVDVRDPSCSSIIGSVTGSAATAGSTTEVKILLSDVGIDSDRTIPSQIETSGLSDLVQGLFPQVPGPTAVRLDGFRARSEETLWGFGGAAALLVLAAGGLVLRWWVRRSQVVQ